MIPLRTVIVDDERLARRRLRRLAADAENIQVIGEAADGVSAVAMIKDVSPDLVLLDVQMPECDGFEAMRRVPPPWPLVIFVTAFDEFAIAAFDIHAVDYLLKPVSRDRLSVALARARERLAHPADVRAAMAALFQHAAERTRYLTRLPVRAAGGRVDLVDVAEIDWIEAADNYVVLHCGRRAYLLRESLSRLETRLDPARFVRIHRSTIVRVDRVVRLNAVERGDYAVTLADGSTLSLSRTHRRRLQEVLGRRF